MKASREILVSRADVVSDSVLARKCVPPPQYCCGRRQVVTALSILCSPPRSGAFIAVVADCCWTPFSSLSESFPEAAEATREQVKYSLGVVSKTTLDYLYLSYLDIFTPVISPG